MAKERKLPRPFEMHWGSGEIIEEAAATGEWHEPAIQLLEYTEGDAAGTITLRFCSYKLAGRFQRSPLMLDTAELDGLRQALKSTPRLQEILRRLVE